MKPSERNQRRAESLGASRVVDLGQLRQGGPLDLWALRHEVGQRLRSTGGRPTDPRWTVSRLVPFSGESWERLRLLADDIGRQRPRVGPAQLAAILVERALGDLGRSREVREAIRRREPVRAAAADELPRSVDRRELHDEMKEALRSAELRAEHLRIATPPAGLTHGEKVVVGLRHWCARSFRAVRLLLDEGLAEHAGIVGRTLVADSVVLRYFANNASNLEVLALRYVKDSISAEMGFARAGVGLDSKAAARTLAELETELTELHRRRAKLGIKSLKKLPSEGDMANQVGQEDFAFFHTFTSRFVHTSRLALSAGVAEEGEDTLTLRAGGVAYNTFVVGKVSAQAFLGAEAAAAILLKSDNVDQWVSTFHEVVDALDQLLLRAGKRLDT